jgi:epoxyqueuosine reductase
MTASARSDFESVAARLIHWIQALGWRARLVPVDHLSDLREALSAPRERGYLDESFYRENLAGFSFELPSDLPGARSILIVAVPTPRMRVVFHWENKRLPAVLPPTYVSYSARTDGVQLAVGLWLRHAGFGAANAILPLKTLAVRTGLAEQGRNNLCYVSGMGSFLQLVGLYSELPCTADPWREPVMLAGCAACSSCLKQCPSGAIAEDRFLLHAERCLTLHSESAKEFPPWIEASWHHCLVGCMRCQDCCPENRGVARWVEDRGEFSEPETAALLQRGDAAGLPAPLAAKLRSLELSYDAPLLGRNLAALIANVQPAARETAGGGGLTPPRRRAP